MKKKITPPFIGTRKIIKVGDGVYVNVPHSFLDGNSLKIGDMVGVYANKDMLVSASVDRVKKAHKKIEELITEK